MRLTAYLRRTSANSFGVTFPHIFWLFHFVCRLVYLGCTPVVCEVHQWSQCCLLAWDGNYHSVFVDFDCDRRYLDYVKKSFLGGHQVAARLSPQTLSRIHSHWWLGEVGVLSYAEWQWRIAKFTIMIFLISLQQGIHLLTRAVPHYRNTV